MRKIKVLMVTTTLGIGSGVNTFVMNYCRELDWSKITVDILTYKKSSSGITSPYIKEIEDRGGRVFLLPSIKNIRQHMAKINEILDEGDYDIIHNNTLLQTIPMMVIAKRKKVPVRILHSHATKLGETTAKDIRNRLMLPILKFFATDYVACSKLAGEAMFGKKPYTVLPNVIDGECLKFDASRRAELRALQNIEDNRIVLSVGRIVTQKNPLFAVDVCCKAHEIDERIVYWWIGNGPRVEEVQAYIKQKQAEEFIKLWGNRNDVIDFYQMADCFFLPSLFEGLPLTGVEAQAMGIPSVISEAVTRELEYTDLVEFVSLDATAGVWSNAILRAMEAGINREKYSQELANSIFSTEKAGSNLISLYTDLLENVKNECKGLR